ncbi:uncharacterized protein FA14DRAFT_156030 [Meira miltonrushii]|uniref:Uncharacterized protein n=1 Tax=Meira miltonrushii TaxID=1280837 RepID=A0A316VCQ6_9BASI|nr:uncharacterized protein FA14DRAFT_156030 [Meira miltonrushii]PWN33335.1 hypothetical protein FA14DRAFT_156030 [Meira miltonrushii]
MFEEVPVHVTNFINDLHVLMTLFVIVVLLASYVSAVRLDKRAIDRGFNLNESPPISPSQTPSPQPENRHSPPISTKLSLVLNKQERKRASDRKYAAKWTVKAMEKAKATMNKKDHEKLVEKLIKRRARMNRQNRKVEKARKDRIAAGTQTQKDEQQMKRIREKFKNRYIRKKTKQTIIQAEKKVENANSAALAQIGASFQPHWMSRQNTHTFTDTKGGGQMANSSRFAVLFAFLILYELLFDLSTASPVSNLNTNSGFYKRTSGQEKDKELEQAKSEGLSSPISSKSLSFQPDTATDEKRKYDQLLRTRDKRFKYTQEGLKIAESSLDPNAYAKLKAKAELFHAKNKQYQKNRREKRRDRFAIGMQSEQDERWRMLRSEGAQRVRAKKKIKRQMEETEKGIKDANSAVLAQLLPSKSITDRLSKQSKHP